MSPGALQHLLRTRLDLHLARPTLARVHAASGGNPMFAVEFARLELIARTAGHSTPLSVPNSLGELVTARVAAISAELMPLLQVASALERPTRSVLAAALEDGDEPDELIARAVRAEALTQGDGELEIRFAHPLLAAAVYFDMPLSTRRALHARLALLVPGVEERGRHAALAADEPNAATARLVHAAATEAARRGALDAAATLAAEAARLTPDPDERRERELESVGYLIDTGEFPAARSRLEQLLTDDVPAAARARALVLRAECEIANRLLIVQLLEEALAIAEDPRLRWQASIRLAQHGAWVTGDALGAVSTAREALAIALEVADPVLVAESEGALAYYESARGLRPGPPAARNGKLPPPQPRAPWWQIGPGLSLGTRLMWAGELDVARRELLAEIEQLRRAGREARAGYALITLSVLEWRAGRWDRAEETAAETIAILGDLILTAYPRLLLDVSRGHEAEARTLGRQMLEWAEALADGFHPPLVGHAIGLLELSRDDHSGALAAFEPAAAQLAQAGIDNPGYLPILPDLVESLIGKARLEEAVAVAAKLAVSANQVDTPWANCLARRAESLVLLAQGRSADAAAAAEETAEALASLGLPLDYARAQLTAGDAYRRLGERRRAATAIEGAATVFGELGAPLWLDRAERELRRASPTSRKDRDRDELTPAEKRVAALVAAGRANKEVAAELFTTVATVEAHLTRIYRKLGIRSRSELARQVGDGSLPLGDVAK
jgi:DNA-binding CsgD family transcriptional regulator